MCPHTDQETGNLAELRLQGYSTKCPKTVEQSLNQFRRWEVVMRYILQHNVSLIYENNKGHSEICKDSKSIPPCTLLLKLLKGIVKLIEWWSEKRSMEKLWQEKTNGETQTVEGGIRYYCSHNHGLSRNANF